MRDALGGAHHDYTQGPLSRAIFLLAIPMVLEMVGESAFAVCDLYFISDALGKHAIAALGYTESMLTIVFAIAIGLAMATTATVARRVGEKDLPAAAEVGAQSVYLGLTLALLLGVPCAFLGPWLLGLMSDEAAVVEQGSTYARIILGTNGVILLLFLHNAIFRGAGDAMLALRTLWLANGINLVLDPCLIYGLGPFPELGLTGAAIATTCGRSVGVAYQLWVLRGTACRVRISGAAWRLRPSIMLRLLRLSGVAIFQFLIATSSWIALMRIVGMFGSAAAAGYTSAIRVVMFTLLPSWGLSNAAATLVGQNLGAGHPDRAERSVWITGFYNSGFLLLLAIAFLVAPEAILSIFTDDPEVLAFGATSLRILACGYPFYAWGMVLVQAFNGAGDSTTPTWINLFCFWVLQIPAAFTMAHALGMGPSGVFWAIAGAESLLAVIAALVFRRGRWRTQSV